VAQYRLNPIQTDRPVWPHPLWHGNHNQKPAPIKSAASNAPDLTRRGRGNRAATKRVGNPWWTDILPVQWHHDFTPKKQTLGWRPRRPWQAHAIQGSWWTTTIPTVPPPTHHTSCLGIRGKASTTMPGRAYRSQEKIGWIADQVY
jgi:hypothetical protein